MAFTFDAKIYTIGPKDAVEVKQPDGTINQLTLPFETNNIRIEEAGKYIKVTLINFVNRSLNCIGYWDKKNSAIIVISPAFKGAFSGVGSKYRSFSYYHVHVHVNIYIFLKPP